MYFFIPVSIVIMFSPVFSSDVNVANAIPLESVVADSVILPNCAVKSIFNPIAGELLTSNTLMLTIEVSPLEYIVVLSKDKLATVRYLPAFPNGPIIVDSSVVQYIKRSAIRTMTPTRTIFLIIFLIIIKF